MQETGLAGCMKCLNHVKAININTICMSWKCGNISVSCQGVDVSWICCIVDCLMVCCCSLGFQTWIWAVCLPIPCDCLETQCAFCCGNACWGTCFMQLWQWTWLLHFMLSYVCQMYFLHAESTHTHTHTHTHTAALTSCCNHAKCVLYSSGTASGPWTLTWPQDQCFALSNLHGQAMPAKLKLS